MRRSVRTAIYILFALASILACSRSPGKEAVDDAPGVDASPTIRPTATPPPQPSPTPTEETSVLRLVRGDPKALVLEVQDLPAGFQAVTEEYDGANQYTVAYFQPQALLAEDLSAVILLGVTVNLGIYGGAEAAAEQFQAQGGLDRESILSSIAEASPDATPIDVQPNLVRLPGTDQALSFRVEYAIESTHLVSYRYRFSVGNALANVIVTARTAGPGQEPSALRDRAQAIAEQQVVRLIEAQR